MVVADGGGGGGGAGVAVVLGVGAGRYPPPLEGDDGAEGAEGLGAYVPELEPELELDE